MYYVPPGHIFQVLEDSQTLEFSPTDAFKEHMQKVANNMESAGVLG